MLLASETYGTATTSFSTYQELNYVIDHKKPYFLIKMCDKWREPHVRAPSATSSAPSRPGGGAHAMGARWQVRGVFGERTMYEKWVPGTPMPHTLVRQILQKLQKAEVPNLDRNSSASNYE